ncbi:hypothetical protein GCM10027093_73680 [Paraburkholderia jirisanensis]
MGWLNTLSRSDFDKKAKKPDKMDGLEVPPSTTLFQSGLPRNDMNLTRHHVIPHMLLIEVWEHAVAKQHRTVIDALTVWAGKSPSTDLPASFTATTPDPQAVLRRVAWNPFNIVYGPLGEHRVDDPGSDFDHFEFRVLTPANPTGSATAQQLKDEALARADFNRHFGTLRRIYNLIVRYVKDDVSSQDIESLCTLLRSDLPARYPSLNAVFNKSKSSNKALLSPDLWANYSTDPNVSPEDTFATASAKATKFAGATAVVVPWNATSWLPEPDPVLPLDAPLRMDDALVWQSPGDLPPNAHHRTDLELSGLAGAALRVRIVATARESGKRTGLAQLSGPQGELEGLARTIASELGKLNRDGYDFKILAKFGAHPSAQLSFYDV